MLSGKQKTKSLSLLQILITAYIMLAPAVFGYADTTVYVYVLMLGAGAVFLLRAIHSGKIYISLCHLALSLLWCYGLVSSFWVTNRSVHFVYLSVVAAAAFVIFLVTEYFTETPVEKSSRRIMYMLSVGSVLCAAVNFIYWLTEIVPLGRDEKLSVGMGTNHFLAVLMLVGIASAVVLFKGNSRLRKTGFVLGIALMLFVLFNCSSIYAWMLLAAMLIILLFGKKSEKRFLAVATAVIFLFTAALISIFFLSDESRIFKDVFFYGNIFGKGGGFLSACELYSAICYSDAAMPGLISSLYASSGVIGLLCAFMFVFKPVMHFVRLRTPVSAFNLLVTVMIMFLPLGNSLTVIVMWLGIIAYNEKAGAYTIKHPISLNTESMKKISPVLVFAGLVTVVFICQRFMVISAEKQFEKENYNDALSLYKAAASVNVFDSESALGAAKTIAESIKAKENYEEAISYAEIAQKRDKNNLQCKKIEADLHCYAGKYKLAVAEYTEIASKAKVNYEYNLLLAETLYKIAETSPEGSEEAISAYEKIVEVAKRTDNLDYREKINNIADKALVYKRRRTEIE